MINRKQKFKLPLKKKIIFFLMGSFCIGILIANILGSEYFSRVGVISEYFIEKYKYEEINSVQLFNYILEKRMLAIIVLWFMGYTIISGFVNRAYLIWCGFSMGIAISCLVMKFGIRGVIIFSGAVFPHYILYFAAIIILMYKSESFYDELHKAVKKKGLIFEYLAVLFVCIVLVVLGIVLESFVNPFVLQKILN